MQKSVFKISVMTRKEVDIAIDWAASEGWNPGLHDADCFYAADPNGFLTGRLGNEIIATISAVKYGDSFGFLGFYMVKPAYPRPRLRHSAVGCCACVPQRSHDWSGWRTRATGQLHEIRV